MRTTTRTVFLVVTLLFVRSAAGQTPTAFTAEDMLKVAAITISGKVDMVSFYTDSPRLGVRNTHAPEKSQDRIGGTLWEYQERYLDHSAVLRADRVTTPLLTISGDQDPNVPASQSREMYYALRRLGKRSSGCARSTGRTVRRTASRKAWTSSAASSRGTTRI